MYDMLIFIGRFSPFHLGHQEVVERALSLSKRVLVLVGSSGSARSPRNPFTFEERKKMINLATPKAEVFPLHDHTYNDTAWVAEVQSIVQRELLGNNWSANGLSDFDVGLIGCEKDHTSYYLRMFPDWASEAVEFLSPLNATAIRAEFFEQDLPAHELSAVLDPKVAKWLDGYRGTALFNRQKAEYDYLRDYRKKYGEGPFLTADALVQVGGKILLVTRGKEYGHGLLAMPGGFLGKYEKFRDGMVRELREETRLRVPTPVLLGSIASRRIYDDPHRDARARLVTEAFHINLVNDTRLPEVRGSDDADHADWYDVANLREDRMFGDHYHIIKDLLKL